MRSLRTSAWACSLIAPTVWSSSQSDCRASGFITLPELTYTRPPGLSTRAHAAATAPKSG